MRKPTARMAARPATMGEQDTPVFVDGELVVPARDGKAWHITTSDRCGVCHGRGLLEVKLPRKGEAPVGPAPYRTTLCGCVLTAIRATTSSVPTDWNKRATELEAKTEAAEAELSAMAGMVKERPRDFSLRHRFQLKLAQVEALQKRLCEAMDAVEVARGT